MKKYLKNINLRELFFPVVSDLDSINEEINIRFISNNNWDLANNDDEYRKVLAKIKEAKNNKAEAETESDTTTNNYVIL